jgi:threonine dehydrogenase-like Zn-dependent dehydrogenase
MRAVAVYPYEHRVRIIDHAEPQIISPWDVKLRMLEVGVCGTDKDICTYRWGSPPRGWDYFVLGHESLGEVVEVGREVRSLVPGDLVVSVVRHPCSHSHCHPCQAGRQDFCATGDYAEHGIKGMHGFMTELIVEHQQNLHRVPRELRDVGVLVEPLTIVEKVLLQLASIRLRLPSAPQRAVVLGAGPIGLLGAMALINAGFETWVYSRSPGPNPKADIAEAIGAHYISSSVEPVERLSARIGPIDVVYEAVGGSQIAFDLLQHLAPNGIFIFTGIPAREESVQVQAHDLVANLIMKNQIVMGTVNAGADAFEAAVRDLSVFQTRWPGALRSLITGRYPLEEFHVPVFGEAAGIKNVLVVQ